MQLMAVKMNRNVLQSNCETNKASNCEQLHINLRKFMHDIMLLNCQAVCSHVGSSEPRRGLKWARVSQDVGSSDKMSAQGSQSRESAEVFTSLGDEALAMVRIIGRCLPTIITYLLFLILILEMLLTFPSMWVLLDRIDAAGAILVIIGARFSQCPLRVHQIFYLLSVQAGLEDPLCGHFIGKFPRIDYCCSVLLPLSLAVMDIIWLVLQARSTGTTTKAVVMAGTFIMLTFDLVIFVYLMKSLPHSQRHDQLDTDTSYTQVQQAEARVRTRSVRKGIRPVSFVIEAVGKGGTGQEESVPESCAICLGDLIPGDEAQQLPCKHLFHTHCIREWLLRSSQCPLRCPQQLLPPKKTPRSDLEDFSAILPGQVEPLDV